MLFQDLQFATRSLWRHRFSTGLALLILGIGFASAISVFTLVHQIVLSRLPYPHADRLVAVFSSYPDGGLTSLSPLVVRDFQERSRSLDALEAYDLQPVHLLTGGDPVRVVAARMSVGLQQVLGLKTRLGRRFAASEATPGRDQSVILGHRLWLAHFGGDERIVGKPINVDDAERIVVGVASPDFEFPEQVDMFIPLALAEAWYSEDRRGWEFLSGVGRTKDGIESAAVSTELSEILAAVAPRRAARGQGAQAVPLQEQLVGDRKPALLTIFLSASFLVLMAWFNVANVLLARAESRCAEFSLRMALGAGRSGLLRLLVGESAVLGLLGGLGGLLVSWFALRWAGAPVLELSGFRQGPELPASVAIVALVFAVLTGVSFGMIPALHASGFRLAEVLRSSARGSASGVHGQWWRKGLVAAQVALTVCLLVAVTLLVGSLDRLNRVDPGFTSDRLLSLRLELPSTRYQVAQRGEFHRRILEEMGTIPGVSEAALAYTLPLSGRVWTASFEIEGRAADPNRPDPGGNMRPVSNSYFRTMRIPLVEGRFFEESDSVQAPPVAVVDSALARQFWGEASPVGARLLDLAGNQPVTIVGVVGTVKDVGLHLESNGHIYFPLSQRPDIRQFNLIVRSELLDPLVLADAISKRVRSLDPALPVFGLTTLDRHVAGTLRGYRQGVTVVSLFGVLSLLLASAGIFGVSSYSVVCRTPEIGVRMALGAQRAQVLRLMLFDTLKVALPGLVVGLAVALALARTIESFVVGIEVTAWAVLVPVIALTLITCLLAGLQPAWRAARTNCLEAIRWE